MFFIGIDIAKNTHEASIIDLYRKLVSESISFSNSIKGFEKLKNYIFSFDIDCDNSIIGMEATGHYWLSLYSALIDFGFNVVVINPIQSDAFRKLYIRQTKNDSVDSFVIAQVLRFGEFSISHFSDEDTFALRNLSRYRFALKSFSFKIKQIINQISFLEEQIKEIEVEISSLIADMCPVITTITGIGNVLGAAIYSEIGDISRFERASQLVAYAGLDVAVKQSGEFVGTQTKISKRGSPYLRRAIWLAAIVAAFKDPALSNYYQTLRNRGKAHGTAIGAVARKLTNIIFAVLRDNKAYIPNI